MIAQTTVIGKDELLPIAGRMLFDGVCGTYDPETGEVGIFLNDHPEPAEKTIEVINHEYLHGILHDIEGLEVSEALDNIDGKGQSLFEELNR